MMNGSDSRRSGDSPSSLDEENDKDFQDIPLKELNETTRDVEGNSMDSKSGDSKMKDSNSGDPQAGVKNMEAVSMTWSRWGLILAYMR
jgi:hypothetical protein